MANKKNPKPQPTGLKKYDLPLMPIIVGAVLFLGLGGLLVYGYMQSPHPGPTPKVSSSPNPSPSTGTVDQVKCDPNEQVATHYHVHLDILNGVQQVSIPAQIGITSSCLYWLHVHDGSGIIHIEAPSEQAHATFTLGNFFDVWRQPLSNTEVATIKLQSTQTLTAYVDGVKFVGDVRTIPLKSHSEIVLDITPPDTKLPTSYTFPDGY